MGLLCAFHDNNMNNNKNNNINDYMNNSNASLKPMFSKNEVVIWDDLLNKSIIRLKYSEPVKKIYLNRVNLIVQTMNKIFIYKFRNPPELIFTLTTRFNSIIYYHKHNEVGKMSTTTTTKNDNLLVFESPNDTNLSMQQDIIPKQFHHSGQLTVYSLIDGKEKIIETGHKQNINHATISNNGKYMATTSTNGTIIKLFSLNNGSLYQEFRRSIEMAPIYQLKFNPIDNWICCISTKQTLHIFQIKYDHETTQDNKTKTNSSVLNKYYLNFLPTDTKVRNKSICSIKLINPTIRNNNKTKFDESDRCLVNWINNDTIILIWFKYKIYEKYSIKFDDKINNFFIMKESWNFFQ